MPFILRGKAGEGANNSAVVLQKTSVKLQKPRNDCSPLSDVGTSQSLMMATLSGSIAMPSVLIMKPRYLVEVTENSLFLTSTGKPACRSRSSTLQTCSSCLSGSSE